MALTGVEEVPIADGHGRVSARSVSARFASPQWDNSAMDGYAVVLSDVAGASEASPVRLLADKPDPMGGWDRSLARGQAVAVMTGAPVPQGCEAIVPVENVEVGDGWVDIRVAPVPGAHVRRAGEDVAVGATVVRAGDRLGSAALAALASTGHAFLDVRDRPRVAIVATGSELVAPGAKLPPRGGFDSNSLMLSTAARAAGAEVVSIGRVPDDPAGFIDAVEMADADLVVTTGGVSMGAFDVVKAALEGTGVSFVRLAMQPGKPQGIGRLPGGKPILALPGNPVSALASFDMFVRPAIRAALGQDPWPVPERATVAARWTSPVGKLQVVPVTVDAQGVRLATPGGSASHLVVALARGEAWALVEPDVEDVETGDTVAVVRWDS